MPELMGHAMGRVRHIHFVGIGGAGMSGIAEVMHNLGYEVSGSDMKSSGTVAHLQELGIKVQTGHSASHMDKTDVVVVSSAIAKDNPELLAAREKRVPVIPRAEMLAELMRFRQGIAVAGTHGKTTTTSLVASLLAEGGLDPTYVIGGQLTSSGSNAKLGEGQYLVAEADESDASFLHLQPIIAVLTNIDADHLETYDGDFEALKANFIEFLHHLPFYGLAVLCADDPGVEAISEYIAKPMITYGLEKQADFTATINRQEAAQTWFTVERRGNKPSLDIKLNLPGRHNVLNSLAAIAVASELGVKDAAIIKGLENFQGIARRCDVRGHISLDNKSLLMIDDYAHHPREIAMILDAVKTGWPEQRLIVVFQPHRYSRTRDLFEDFSHVLADIDVLIMLDVYAAGEHAIAGADSRSLCRAIRLRGKVEPIFLEQRDEIHSLLPGLVEDGDILLILGAGDIGSLNTELLQRYGNQVH